MRCAVGPSQRSVTTQSLHAEVSLIRQSEQLMDTTRGERGKSRIVMPLSMRRGYDKKSVHVPSFVKLEHRHHRFVVTRSEISVVEVHHVS